MRVEVFRLEAASLLEGLSARSGFGLFPSFLPSAAGKHGQCQRLPGELFSGGWVVLLCLGSDFSYP